MLILTLRSDKPEAEIGLFDNQVQIAYDVWQAHRALAETIHSKIASLLEAHSKNFHDIQGIVVYKGPGSFTGLRIGLSVANALASGLDILIVATKDDTWIHQGIERILKKQTDQIALPDYGSAAHTTLPRGN